VKRFNCMLCDYVTAQESKLRRHVYRVHAPEKNHKCLKCDFTTAYSGSLLTHIKTVHNKIRDYKCPHCDYKAAQSVKVVHQKIRDKKCPQCDYTAAHTGTISRHMQAKHDKILDKMSIIVILQHQGQEHFSFTSRLCMTKSMT
jgi:hypothetical protein